MKAFSLYSSSLEFIYFYKGKQFLTLRVCFPGEQSPSKMGTALKEKNLLLQQQILPLESSALLRGEAKLKNNRVDALEILPGPGCSKLTMSLVKGSLKFQTLISQTCQYFLSSPLAGKRDMVVAILVRCMCVRPCICASVRPCIHQNLSRP